MAKFTKQNDVDFINYVLKYTGLMNVCDISDCVSYIPGMYWRVAFEKHGNGSKNYVTFTQNQYAYLTGDCCMISSFCCELDNKVTLFIGNHDYRGIRIINNGNVVLPKDYKKTLIDDFNFCDDVIVKLFPDGIKLAFNTKNSLHVIEECLRNTN